MSKINVKRMAESGRVSGNTGMGAERAADGLLGRGTSDLEGPNASPTGGGTKPAATFAT